MLVQADTASQELIKLLHFEEICKILKRLLGNRNKNLPYKIIRFDNKDTFYEMSYLDAIATEIHHSVISSICNTIQSITSPDQNVLIVVRILITIITKAIVTDSCVGWRFGKVRFGHISTPFSSTPPRIYGFTHFSCCSGRFTIKPPFDQKRRDWAVNCSGIY